MADMLVDQQRGLFPRWTEGLFVFAFLCGHVCLAAIWWWLQPGGFPAWHGRFWINQVLPILVSLLIVSGLIADLKRRVGYAKIMVVGLCAMWFAVGLASVLYFPRTAWGQLPWVIGGLSVILVFNVFVWRFLSPPLLTSLISALVAMIVGAVLPYSQRAPAASTKPLNVPMTRITTPNPTERLKQLQLAHGLEIDVAQARVQVPCAGLRLSVQPLLSFQCRSPDRFWSFLAPHDERVGPLRKLIGVRQEVTGISLAYHSDLFGLLRVEYPQSKSEFRVQSLASLPEPIYSHLNRFCSFEIKGHTDLKLGFSAIPDFQVPFLPMDYPYGRPVQLAYLSADQKLHVVRAVSAEKGPFRRLSSGRLHANDSLSMTLFDGSQPKCRITLMDFASQASTELSPTAGWGLAQNAILFNLTGDDKSAPARLLVSLAATGVGRGYDTVGHKAGTYLNRIRIQDLSR